MVGTVTSVLIMSLDVDQLGHSKGIRSGKGGGLSVTTVCRGRVMYHSIMFSESFKCVDMNRSM